ncbi:MAG: hypothetical protein ACI8RD_011634, partial [Bacillariaceae sp.]
MEISLKHMEISSETHGKITRPLQKIMYQRQQRK